MSRIRTSLASLSLLLPLALPAQTAPPGNTPAPPDRSQAQPTMRQQPSGADLAFARAASRGNAEEIAMGKIATDNSQTEAVRQYGQRLVQDHSKANQQLEAIAARKGLHLAPPTPQQGGAAQEFRQMRGKDFDRAFADRMVQDHQKTIALFRQEASHGSDPDLRAFARDTLPVLESHLQTAQSLQHVDR